MVIATLDDSVINNARNIPGTNRWVLEWAPQVPGTYNISAQAIDEDMGSSVINTSRWLVITPKSSSLPPLVSLSSPSDGGILHRGFKPSNLCSDRRPDGYMEWIRFYVNGEPVGEPISAFDGLGSSTYPYSLLWQVPESGVYSFHAVAMDNSKNGIMSGISTITATSGQGALPQVSFSIPIQLAEGSLETTDGQITSIDLVTGGYGYTSAPEVEILGGNGDAQATATVESDQSSPTYGQVISIEVNEPGSGYDESATIQLIGGFSKVQPSGTGAQAQVVWGGPGRRFYIEVTDGGEGYTSPPEVTIYGAGRVCRRLPL